VDFEQVHPEGLEEVQAADWQELVALLPMAHRSQNLRRLSAHNEG